jgi:hypothetical protein
MADQPRSSAANQLIRAETASFEIAEEQQVRSAVLR